ncbi:MAG: phosphatidate cytidylyltransferase [Phycisphaeraceae bacterium]|nr:MAG: phosphatidate cytidylyltransferase [Phycisphaeraceae bacterium]
MLVYRLTLGPVLILAIIAAAFGDQWMDSVAMPGFASGWTGDGTFPPCMFVLPITVLLSVVASRELSALLKSKGVEAARRVNATLAVAGLLLAAFVPSGWSGVGGAGVINASVGLVIVGSIAYYARGQRVEGMLAAAGGALMSFAYLGLLMGFAVLIRREQSVWVLVWVVVVTKSCDIGAFFTGTAIGKRKLIPWLSPGKTWEGLFGGLATSAVVGALGVVALESWAGVRVSGPWAAAGAGVVFGFVGQCGDLLASLLKRDAGVKDSGRTLPGFGGVLDVIDSPLLVLPVAFWWVRSVAGVG